MNIFYKRPLGLILCVFLCGFTLFSISGDLIKIIITALSASFIAAVLLLKNLRRPLIIILAIILLVAIVFSYVFFDVFFYPGEYFGTKITVEGKVTHMESEGEYSKVIHLETDAIEGIKEKHTLLVYLYGNTDDIAVGDCLAVYGKLEDFSATDSFDFKNYYTAKGISGKLTSSEITVNGNAGEPILYKFAVYREKIKNLLISRTDRSAGGLLCTLLLGERDVINPELERDFGRIGIIHTLSLSGMHLTLIVAFIDRLLRIFGINRTVRSILGCVFSLLFMALTGFPITVCRAGIMLIISTLVMLASGNRDAITSLSIATTIIILVNPYSAFDTGLWLSVFSTLGLIIAAEYSSETDEGGKISLAKRFGIYLKLSLFYTALAIIASMVITAFTFDQVSILPMITGPIFSILLELIIYLGLITLLIGGIINTSAIHALMYSVTKELSAFFSDFEFSYVSTGFTAVKLVLLVLVILFFVFLIINVKRRRLFMAAILSVFAFSMILSFALTYARSNEESIVASSDDGADMIILTADGESLFFDASSHNSSAVFSAANFLGDEDITSLDYYYVANYSAALPEMIVNVISRIYVKCFVFPECGSEADESIRDSCIKMLSGYRVTYKIAEDGYFALGSLDIQRGYTADTRRDFSYHFRYGENIYSYLSSGLAKINPLAELSLYSSAAVIFGNYGSGYSQNYYLDEYGAKLDKILIYDKQVIPDLEYANGVGTDVFKYQKTKLYLEK